MNDKNNTLGRRDRRPQATDPAPSLGRLIARTANRLQTDGINGVASRVAREISIPTTWPGRLGKRVLEKPFLLAKDISTRFSARRPASDTLFAVYDLEVQPVTYDFLWFLVQAEEHRRKLGLGGVHVVVAPARAGLFRSETADYDAVIDTDKRAWRLTNIILPTVETLPSARGVTLAESRAMVDYILSGRAARFPEDYSTSFPTVHFPGDAIADGAHRGPELAALRAPSAARSYVKNWLENTVGSARPVVLTLREYGFGLQRNSNLHAWAEFAAYCRKRGFAPILVRDTDMIVSEKEDALNGLTTCPQASWNSLFRAALYECAWMNAGVNNGPMALCWLNARTAYFTIKMITDSVPQTRVESFEARGIATFEDYSFAGRGQHLVWKDDSVSNLIEAFEFVEAQIDP